jgi:Phosphotransferase enzyme family
MAIISCDDCSVDADARRELAVQASLMVARRFGIDDAAPKIIKDSNNTIVDLGTANLVAKVATNATPDHSTATEFAILSHLHHKNAPTSCLSDRIDHGPHDELGCRLLFLDRLEIIDAPVAVSDALAVLYATHEALADLSLTVVDFDDSFVAAQELFEDGAKTAALSDQERQFCAAVGSRLRERLNASAWQAQARILHGDPWVGGNLVNTVDGPRLIDFEAVCRGPVEWDLSSAVEGVPDGVNGDLLALCRSLRSFTVAAYCWAQPGRAADVDEAAQWHLRLLHETFDR